MLILLDTFALVTLAADTEKATRTKEFFVSGNHELVVGLVNLMEIAGWPRRWAAVADLVSSVRFCVVKNPEDIAREEVLNYPTTVPLPVSFRSVDTNLDPAEAMATILSIFDERFVRRAKSFRDEYVRVLVDILAKRSQYSPLDGSRHSEAEKTMFLISSVFGMLGPEHRAFLQSEVAKGQNGVRIECLRSVYIQALAVYMEYYVQNKPGKPSDMGDFLQLAVVPYVDLAVLDRERTDLVKRMKRASPMLGNVTAKSLAELLAMI